MDADIPPNSTCRICRGEATEDSPLFHPCKCRGSIKYIHESCLLEWIASKNIDISKPNTEVSCDICHHPFNFKTTYVENMPEKIPFIVLMKSTLKTSFMRLKKAIEFATAIALFFFGWPLVWNALGKLYTFILDGSLPFKNDLTRSLLFGFPEQPELYANIKLDEMTVLKQLLWNYKFTGLQIALIVILHIALYFQYDMIVREEVFSKMILHKIGPKISINDMKARLMERFPMMDEVMIDHLAEALRAREINRNDPPPAVPQNLANNNQNIHELDMDSDGEENDPDFVPVDENVNESESDEDNNNNQGFENGEFVDPFRERFEEMMNRRAQNQFDNLIAQQQEQRAQNAMNRPNAPVFIPPVQQENAANDQERENVPNGVANAANADDGGNVLLINIKLNFSIIIGYFVIGSVVCSLYLLLAYLIPTFIGFGLLKLYSKIIEIFMRGVLYLVSLTYLDKIYFNLLNFIPFGNLVHEKILVNVSNGCQTYYFAYQNNTMKNSMFLRSLPSITTYLTTIAIIAAVSEFISKGYGKMNGMTNNLKRQIFQITFALRCTFKVFTLFFIELAGFPILAGVMLDVAFFCPILRSNSDILCIPYIFRVWFPLSFFVYWIIGTLYMYWFAKYIGMIRKDIIRPGVLFFIRSPEDPNIRILHDSLIHPMGIQLSRLCLSMFIYAVFIIVGFGFHTRLLFPIILKSNFFSIAESLKPDSIIDTNAIAMSLTCYATRYILEDNSFVKKAVKDYWIYVFKVCARNLRLSSFILGNDVATERGHILYRNYFYQLFASQSAQWSNPELFTSPKTYEEASRLFQEKPNIHAYFIPDGILMRVPSSDIVSRSYVQTMFVPVTTDDKLLKPLDLEKINQRNKATAGEFGYLDEQNTEFDHYFVVYVPPNFRMKYMILISLIWLFSSFLLIGITVVSHFTTRLFCLPVQLFVPTWLTEQFTNHINIYFVCIGSIFLSSLIPKYYAFMKHRTAVVVDNEDSHDHEEDNNNLNERRQEVDDDQLEAGVGLLNALNEFKETFAIKFLFGILVISVDMIVSFLSFTMLLYHSVQVVRYLLSFTFSNPLEDFLSYLNMNSILVADNKFVRLYQLLISALVYRKAMKTSAIFFSNRDRRFTTLAKMLLSTIFKKSLKFHLINIAYLTLLALIFNILTNPQIIELSDFSQILSGSIFAKEKNSLKASNWTVLDHSYMVILIGSYLGYLLVRGITFFSNWWHVLEQRVKDSIYTKGKKLENLTEDNN
ncbi:ERAD-associated E3 ubiquitin-protein ligase DOA10 [Nakaseomyces bracarensis]|uniref:RING-type E3 ubiquitin transferase n=1 Tax=Nakaseomyces bracarensis TaxID=273131 RepID=A0ABR4NW44_9SACH